MGVVSVKCMDFLTNPESLLNSFSTVSLDPSIFPITKLEACLDYEDFRFVKLQDAIEQSKVVEVKQTNFNPALCEGHINRVAESFDRNPTTCLNCGKSTSCSKKQ